MRSIQRQSTTEEFFCAFAARTGRPALEINNTGPYPYLSQTRTCYNLLIRRTGPAIVPPRGGNINIEDFPVSANSPLNWNGTRRFCQLRFWNIASQGRDLVPGNWKVANPQTGTSAPHGDGLRVQGTFLPPVPGIHSNPRPCTPVVVINAP